jgi:superfamily II DNA/RNA helicase
MEQRYRAMGAFKEGKYHILVGTDIIARGMNFPNVKNIVSFFIKLIFWFFLVSL